MFSFKYFCLIAMYLNFNIHKLLYSVKISVKVKHENKNVKEIPNPDHLMISSSLNSKYFHIKLYLKIFFQCPNF